MLPFGIVQGVASILLVGNHDKPMGIALQGKPSVKLGYHVNGVVIGYHLVKLNLIAVAIIYQPVKAVQLDSFWTLRI